MRDSGRFGGDNFCFFIVDWSQASVRDATTSRGSDFQFAFSCALIEGHWKLCPRSPEAVKLLTPEYYLKRAIEIEAYAEEIAEPCIRAGYFDLAKSFRAMAKRPIDDDELELADVA